VSIALLGRLLVLAALGAATAGAVVGIAAGRSRNEAGLRLARRLVYAFSAALVGANLLMVYALLAKEYGVSYVAQVGGNAVPTHIAIVSLWSSLEGSILFWGLILGVYCAGFAWSTRDKYSDVMPWTLATIHLVAVFFAFLIAGPANPFLDTPMPVPTDGPGPNALLQNHLLMIIHPPTLYLGYVGMTVPFAMGVGALIEGRLGAAWMKATRTWMLLPWGFLSVGIVLGGWWAYEVLGWGGYWAWDPVENASFLPWLTATAFLHAAMLRERRGILKGWTIVLLIATFSLTILGTFMTRSGVFNSVHSFTQSAIGPTFLVFLAIVLVASTILLALRVHLLEADGEIRSPASRETMFVLNNLLFVAFTFTVLVGTVFPLLAEAVRGVKVSVGGPFFNRMSVPIGVAIVFLMGVGPALPWGRAKRDEVIDAIAVPVGVGVFLVGLGAAFGVRDVWPALTLFAGGFAGSVAVRDMTVPVRVLMAKGQGVGAAMVSAFRRGRRRYGGQIVHLGIAMIAISIAISQSYQVSEETMLKTGESVTVGDWTVQYEGTHEETTPNRRSTIATFGISRDGKVVGSLAPRMNVFRGNMQPIGTPGVRSTITQDLYLSVMNIDAEAGVVGLRAFVNPLVYWIWIGMFVIGAGCLVAAWPSRPPREAAA
jgi:cytochrome c-type biogenesis protein CcmF